VPAIAAETGVRFRWRPLASAELMTARGMDPFAGPAPSGQYDWDYRRRDAEAWADLYGVPFRDNHGRVAYESRLLVRACLAAGRLGRIEDYTSALYRAMFVDDLALIDRAQCVRRADGLGLDRAQFAARLDDPAILAEAAANLAEAKDRGAFGVPTFFLGECMFWGNDRLVLLRHALRRHQGTAAPS
jgi:2-hydroxychromene-2-carboxylate isomerase